VRTGMGVDGQPGRLIQVVSIRVAIEPKDMAIRLAAPADKTGERIASRWYLV